MASNAQKTPFQRSINNFAERKIREAMQLLGKGLPCSVVEVLSTELTSIVTVKFELSPTKVPFTLPQVTLPMFGPEWIRYPTQRGDTGVVIPFDARLGGISGLGSGLADLSTPCNLGALVFMPIANANWDAPEDLNKLILYGPDGAILRSKTGSGKITVKLDEIDMVANDKVEVTVGGATFTVLASGTLGRPEVRLEAGADFRAEGRVFFPNISTVDMFVHGEVYTDTHQLYWTP